MDIENEVRGQEYQNMITTNRTKSRPRSSINIEFKKDEIDIKYIYSGIVACIIVIICLFAYLILTIFGLVKTDRDTVKNVCPDSQIWVYSLVSLIICLILQPMISRCQQKNEKCIKLISCILAIMYLGGLFSWGLYETIGNICTKENLYNTVLYKMSITSVSLQGIGVLFYVCTFLITCICN